jgi:hypothetical protein
VHVTGSLLQEDELSNKSKLLDLRNNPSTRERRLVINHPRKMYCLIYAVSKAVLLDVLKLKKS